MIKEDEKKLVSEDLCNMFYRLLSDTEYASMISGSYGDILYHNGDLFSTYISNLNIYYFSVYEHLIDTINEDNFKIYVKIFEECNLDKYLRKDLKAFKDNLKRVIKRKLHKMWKDAYRIHRLYFYGKKNETFRLLSFDEFISE